MDKIKQNKILEGPYMESSIFNKNYSSDEENTPSNSDNSSHNEGQNRDQNGDQNRAQTEVQSGEQNLCEAKPAEKGNVFNTNVAVAPTPTDIPKTHIIPKNGNEWWHLS